MSLGWHKQRAMQNAMFAKPAPVKKTADERLESALRWLDEAKRIGRRVKLAEREVYNARIAKAKEAIRKANKFKGG